VEEVSYTPEELLAMLLQHAKLLALNHGGKVIKDCVITVPSSFTQHERSALYTAASIADLNVLTLIEENTAAALQYGIDRVHETPTNVLYYNMGAEGIQVTIVNYSSYLVKESGKNKTIGQFEVLGKAWDETVGGFNFDLVIADMLADRFNELWNKKNAASDAKKSIKDYARPMTRLRLEANKIKEVLSANTEFHFKAEQLHADLDLATKITRQEFESSAESLFAKITGPIDQALTMANLSIQDINAVELLGGSVRIPKVKKLLDQYFAKSVEIGQHMNGDEAMALGAAFRAANLSTAFRVRKVGMSDILTFGVSVTLETLKSEEGAGKSGGLFGMFGGGSKDKEKEKAAAGGAEEEGWSKHTSLYPEKSSLPGRTKTVAFQYDQDILCKLTMETSASSTPADELLVVYNITGIKEFAKEVSAKGLGLPKVHLSFSLDSSGIVTLHKAEATVDLPQDPETTATPNTSEDSSTVNATATSASDEETAASAETSTNTTSDEESAANATASETTSSSPAEATANETASASQPAGTKKDKEKVKADKKSSKSAEKKKETKISRVLTITEDHSVLKPASWTPASIAAAKNRLKQLDQIDEARKLREAALNDLEGYIYSIKNKVQDDDGGKISSVTTSEQRDELMALATSLEDWLYEDGGKASINDFKNKHASLRAMAEVILKRVSELKDRPEAIAKAKKILADVEASMLTWEEKFPQITSDEKDKMAELIKKVNDWIQDKEAAQAKVTSLSIYYKLMTIKCSFI
jgi:hypoxia up-regulated 1